MTDLRRAQAIASSPPEPVPLVAGDYFVRENIASGSFGVVCRGEHRSTRAEVAIKILRHELIQHPTATRRFEREIEVLRRLRHPNIVETLDAGRLADGRPYFVMELLRGTVLKDHLAAVGRLPVIEALAILEPLAEALDAAHAEGVIHRDLKPSNVFLAIGPRLERRVLLLDFGVAKLLDTSAPGITESRHVVGTYTCMAPEQLLCGNVDVWTDVYGLGALAYRMLTGRPPFEGASPAVLRCLHLEGRSPRPSLIAPLAPAIDEVILKAMSRSAAERHATPASFVAELRAAATPSGATEPAPKRSVLVVRFEARIGGDTDSASTAVFDESDALVAGARAELSREGFVVVLDAATQLVFARERPTDLAEDLEMRRGALRSILALARAFQERPGRALQVRAGFHVHVGEVAADELVELVPELDVVDGVVASREALRGVYVPDAPATPGEPDGLYRLAFEGVGAP